ILNRLRDRPRHFHPRLRPPLLRLPRKKTHHSPPLRLQPTLRVLSFRGLVIRIAAQFRTAHSLAVRKCTFYLTKWIPIGNMPSYKTTSLRRRLLAAVESTLTNLSENTRL